MSKRRNGCKGKKAHEHQGDAEVHRKSLIGAHGDHGLCTYQCKKCGKWHVGHGVGQYFGLRSHLNHAVRVLYHD